MSVTWDNLEKLGFEAEERPEGNMRFLPEDVTDLAERALMALFGSYTQWTCYAASELTVARFGLREAEYKVTYHTSMAQARCTEKTVAAKKAVAACDPDVLAAEEIKNAQESLVEALEMVHENARLRTQFLSRELSRRIAQRDTDQRNAKWGV